MRYLLDTNIISYFFNGVENIRLNVASNLKDISISTVTCAELFYGIHNAGGYKQGYLREKVEILIKNIEILEFDLKSARVYGAMMKRLKSKGKPLDDLDLQIASIAIANDLVLVTGDKAFLTIKNLTVENWMS